MSSNSEFVRSKPVRADNAGALFGMSHKIIPLLIVLLSFSAAATYFAVTNPDILLDPPLFSLLGYPVYAPWQYIIWVARLYSFESIRDHLFEVFEASSNVLILGCGIAVVVYMVMSYLRGLNSKNDNLYGTARWGSLEDIKKAGLFSKAGVVLGQTSDAIVKYGSADGGIKYKVKRPSTIIAHAGDFHTMLVAPSRSGKGVSTIIPTLLSWQGSVICFDPKGENYETTAGFRRKFSHVVRFAPRSPEVSIRLNPLQEIRPGSDSWSDAQTMAHILLTPSDGTKGDQNAAHFQRLAEFLLTGAILHVIRSEDIENKSLGGVFDFLASAKDSDDNVQGDSLLDAMLESSSSDPEIQRQMRNVVNEIRSAGDRERGSIFTTITGALMLFNDDNIRKTTQCHELSTDDFRNAEYPISLYITVPYSEISKLSPLFRLIIMFIVNRFSSGETRYGKNNLKYKTLFLLDEFPVLGSFPFLETTMGILAGYGIVFLIVVQSLTQINKLYGDKNPFLEHCRILVTFAPGDLTSAKTFSEMIGKETVFKEQISTSGSKFELGMKNMNISGNEVERNLINADEIMKLRPDCLLIFCHGVPPYLGKKVVFYDDKRFTPLINQPFPQSREELLAELPGGGEPREIWKFDPEIAKQKAAKKVADSLPSAEFILSNLPPNFYERAEIPEELDKKLPVPRDFDPERVQKLPRHLLHNTAEDKEDDGNVTEEPKKRSLNVEAL